MRIPIEYLVLSLDNQKVRVIEYLGLRVQALQEEVRVLSKKLEIAEKK